MTTLPPIAANASIAVVGAGALGLYYGARLIQSGRQVHLLVRGDYQALATGGLRVFSRDGDFALSPEQLRLYTDAHKMPRVDWVIVTLKTTANHRFAELIEPLLGADTAILTLQNGLGNEDHLAELFGPRRIVGGLAFVCVNRLEPGVVRHTDYGLIKLGEMLGPGDSPRACAMAEAFVAANVPSQTLKNLHAGRWEKLIWNVPFNCLGAIMDLATDRLVNSVAGRETLEKIMEEVWSVAAADGAVLDRDLIRHNIQRTLTMGAYRSSMQIDRQAGRPLEIDAIVGRPLARAQRHGIDTPWMRKLHEMLLIL